MAYRLVVRPRAARQLGHLPVQEQARLAQAIEALAATPRPRGVEKLRGAYLWRIRVGEYRVVYAIDDTAQTVTVARVGHRRDVYRGL
ncbi:MAG: type II toxin-antitoxin system RelE/ParE family toxin [Chloroflexi bacterium]|nr:type II toxin-antitoxin system RelE/ParE family toxin [Chloroflexota bacterium]